MASAPHPPYVYHITAIPNLIRIAQSGRLLSKSRMVAAGRAHDNIAYENIQDRRSRPAVPVGPGAVLHDYVPFHFAPRQPMLMALHKQNVPDCVFDQTQIVHLVLRADQIAQAGLPYVISTHHAVTMLATFHDTMDGLNDIDWDMFFDPPLIGGYARYFHNPPDKPEYATRRESRQAEILVRDEVPLEFVRGIGVFGGARRQEVEGILDRAGWTVKVDAKPEWYF